MHAEEKQLMRDYAGIGDNINKHKLVFRHFTASIASLFLPLNLLVAFAPSAIYLSRTTKTPTPLAG